MNGNDADGAVAKTEVVTLSGTLDAFSIQPLAGRVSEELLHGCRRLILDMTDVKTLTEGALGALLLRQTEAERVGGTIRLVVADSEIHRTLVSNGFAAVFEICDSLDAAVR